VWSVGFDAFVQPKKVRLSLSHDSFIDIRDRLNAGELEDLHAIWQPLITPGQGVKMQTRQVRFAKVQAYLLGWSYTDHGQPVEVSEGAINSLAPEVFSEIHRAIERHEWQRDAEIEEQKKNPSGATELSETSPSVAP